MTRQVWKWLPDDGQFIVDGEGNIVAEIPCQGCDPENGELIVRCVNSHEALVAALKDLVRQLPNDDRLADYNLDQAEAALELAEREAA